MSFAFGKEQGPIDLTKGGDAGTNNGAEKPQPTLPTPPAGIRVPGLPQAPKLNVPTPVTPVPSQQVPTQPQAPRLPQRPGYQPQAPSYEPQQPVRETPDEATQQYPQQPSPAERYTQQEQPPRSQEQLRYEEPRYDERDYNEPQSSYPQQQQPSYAQQPQDSEYNNYSPQEEGYNRQPVSTQRPGQVPTQPFNRPQPTEYQGVKVEEQQLDKKGRPVKERKKLMAGKADKKKQPAKKGNSYAGDRKKVLWARILVFGITGILILAGINSFLPKRTGLTASDGPFILQQVRHDLGVTQFPEKQGEAWALGFTKAYLTYDPVNGREARFNELLKYAPKNIVESIDLRMATKAEIEQAGKDVTVTDPDSSTGKDGTGTDNGTGTDTGTDGQSGAPTAPPTDAPNTLTPGLGQQVITDGPYLVRTVMIADGKNAIFTTRTQINNKTDIYLEIPIAYDPATKGMSVSGSPTFVQPVQPIKVDSTEYNTTWSNDDEVRDKVSNDLKNYMVAWAAGDKAQIERYTLKKDGKTDASLEAMTGLGGQVVYISTGDIMVQSKKLSDDPTSAEKADFNVREVRMEVNWMEPTSGVVYSQTYELTIEYANENWFVKDIKNIATSAGEYRDKL